MELRKGTRGLPAIAKLREERSRRGSRWTTQAALVAAGAVVVSFIAHTFVSHQDLASDKRALLAKQNAARATLGAQWFPLRERLEQAVVRAAGPYPGDHIEPEAQTGAFRSQPGLYLRMPLSEVKAPVGVARAAVSSQKDAIVACLLREPNDLGARGESDGGAGGAMVTGAFAEQPWNLGQAYWATRVLSPDWAAAVESADDLMRLRVYSAQYDDAVRKEFPLAAEIIKRARFLLLALDEGVDAQLSSDGGSAAVSTLQLSPHPTRIYLFDTSTGKELFRIRRTGQGSFVQVGEQPTTDDETREAMQRQVNNCSLGRQVEAALLASRNPNDVAAPDGQRSRATP